MTLARLRRSPLVTPSIRPCGVSLATSAKDVIQDVPRARRNGRARTVDAGDSRGVEEFVVLRRNHAAHEHLNVFRALLAQRLDDLRHECLVAGGERAHTYRMHVVLDRLTRAFIRRLEERPDVHVEAEIRERTRHDLRAPIVTILSELRDQHARTTALGLSERRDVGLQLLPAFSALIR